MRRFLVALIAAAALFALPAVPASAHVHGITPLNTLITECGVANANSGAIRTDTTPAAQANGGPITGLIPRDVGHSPLQVGDGGFTAPVGCRP